MFPILLKRILKNKFNNLLQLTNIIKLDTTIETRKRKYKSDICF